MTRHPRSNSPWRPARRDVIRFAAASMGAGLTGGLSAATDAAKNDTIAGPHRRLRAAFTNIGLQVTWCAQGKQAAEFWGQLFNVDVTWFDPGLSAAQQAAALEEIASRKWDFVAIQAVEIDTLAAPVNRIIDAGIPVIDMYHWDLPQALQDKYGGWQSPETAKAFGEYGGYVAKSLGDRVTYFFTINDSGRSRKWDTAAWNCMSRGSPCGCTLPPV
jgi:ABC-type sugar transport system substrate-binding protein